MALTETVLFVEAVSQSLEPESQLRSIHPRPAEPSRSSVTTLTPQLSLTGSLARGSSSSLPRVVVRLVGDPTPWAWIEPVDPVAYADPDVTM